MSSRSFCCIFGACRLSRTLISCSLIPCWRSPIVVTHVPSMNRVTLPRYSSKKGRVSCVMNDLFHLELKNGLFIDSEGKRYRSRSRLVNTSSRAPVRFTLLRPLLADDLFDRQTLSWFSVKWRSDVLRKCLASVGNGKGVLPVRAGRTNEKRAQALHRGRKSCHPEAAPGGARAL